MNEDTKQGKIASDQLAKIKLEIKKMFNPLGYCIIDNRELRNLIRRVRTIPTRKNHN